MAKKKITVLILEDNQVYLDSIINLLEKFNQKFILTIAKNHNEGLEQIILKNPEIVIISYELQNTTGFQFLQNIPPEIKSLYIITSVNDKYAFDAFKYPIFDYLLKPIEQKHFYFSLNRAISKIKIDERFSSRLPIRQTGKIIFIEKSKIKFIKASGDYIEIYIDKKKYVVRQSINKVHEELNEKKFHRIHRSTIVNLNLVDEVIFSNYGELDVKMRDEVFRVSRTYKNDLLTKMSVR
jgi:two-component system LytT family response regulator